MLRVQKGGAVVTSLLAPAPTGSHHKYRLSVLSYTCSLPLPSSPHLALGGRAITSTIPCQHWQFRHRAMTGSPTVPVVDLLAIRDHCRHAFRTRALDTNPLCLRPLYTVLPPPHASTPPPASSSLHHHRLADSLPLNLGHLKTCAVKA